MRLVFSWLLTTDYCRCSTVDLLRFETVWKPQMESLRRAKVVILDISIVYQSRRKLHLSRTREFLS